MPLRVNIKHLMRYKIHKPVRPPVCPPTCSPSCPPKRFWRRWKRFRQKAKRLRGPSVASGKNSFPRLSIRDIRVIRGRNSPSPFALIPVNSRYFAGQPPCLPALRPALTFCALCVLSWLTPASCAFCPSLWPIPLLPAPIANKKSKICLTPPTTFRKSPE